MPAPPPSRAEHADPPLGVVLAGGAGRRIGGEKALVGLAGRPLIEYPLATLRSVLLEVVVVAKRGTALPPLPGVAVWTEPDAPQHPFVGVAYALERAGGRDVLVCAGDMPLVPRDVVVRLAGVSGGGAPAVVVRHPAGTEPLLARYRPAALDALGAAAAAGAPARAAVADLGPDWLDEADPAPFRSVNRAEDLAWAANADGER